MMEYDINNIFRNLQNFKSISPRENERFSDYLRKILRKYLSYVESLKADYPNLLQDAPVLIKKISEQNKNIIAAIKLSESGLGQIMAQELIQKIFPNTIFITKEYHKGDSFYRIRRVEVSEKISPSGMFHIPFNEQEKVGIQRYNPQGVPALYLSRSILCCWEELRRPPLQQCSISQIVCTEEFECLDLSIPQFEDGEDSSGFMNELLQMIPIIIACSVRVKHDDGKFKSEYSIPQLLMQLFMLIRRSNYTKYNTDAIGISYESVHTDASLRIHQKQKSDLFNCISIPAINRNQTRNVIFDSDLCEKFAITQPTTEELIRIKHPEIYGFVDLNKDQSDSSEYANTLFGRIEKILSNRSDYPLYKIDPKTGESSLFQ